MSTAKTNNQNDIRELVEQIRQLAPHLSDDELDINIKRWTSTLMQLQVKYKNTPESILADESNIGNYDVFKLLKMGIENKDDFKTVLRAVIENKHQSHAVSYAYFIKSFDGYNIFQKGDTFKKFTEDQISGLVSFFGGEEALLIANNVSKSARAEMLGCLWAYVHSGKSEEDSERYFGLKDQEEIMLQSALKSDQEFAMNANSYHSIKHVKGTLLNINRKHINSVRGKLRPDNFILHNNKATFCNVFSDNDPKGQRKSFLLYFMAIFRAIKNGEIKANDFTPLYLLQSPFPRYSSINNKTKGIGGNLVSYIENGNLTSEQKDTLSQSNFLGLMGNCDHIDKLVILFAHNPSIAGGESTDLFATSALILKDLKNNNLNKARERAIKMAMKKMVTLSDSIKKIIENNELMSENPNNNNKKQFIDTDIGFRSILTNYERNLKKMGDLINMSEDLKTTFDLQISKINKNNHEIINLGLDSGKDDFRELMHSIDEASDLFNVKLNKNLRLENYEAMSAGLQELLNQPKKEFEEPEDKTNSLNVTDLKNVSIAFNRAISQLKDHFNNEDHYINSTAVEKLSLYLNVISGQDLKPSQAFLPYDNPSSASSVYTKLVTDLNLLGCPLMAEFVEKSRFLLQTRYIKEMENGKIGLSSTKKITELGNFLTTHFKDVVRMEEVFFKKENRAKSNL